MELLARVKLVKIYQLLLWSGLTDLSRNPCDNGGNSIDSLYVEENQKFVLAKREKTSKV